MYEIKIKIGAAKWENTIVMEYTNMLKTLCQELDNYWCIETTCPKYEPILKNYIENDWVYDFLVSLNIEFDQVRVQIFIKELLTLNETIFIIRA